MGRLRTVSRNAALSRSWSLLGILGLVLGMVATGACSSDGSDGSGTSGRSLEPYEGEGFTVAHPREWARVEPSQQKNKGFAVEFRGLADGPVSPLVGVGKAARQPLPVRGYAALLFAPSKIGDPSVQVSEPREVTVPGAAEAITVDLRYSLESRPVRERAVLAKTADNVLYNVRISTPADTFDEKVADAVVRSFEVR